MSEARARDNDWKGQDRRQTTGLVSRDEFVSFQRTFDERMDNQDGQFAAVRTELANGSQVMAKLNTAMFAKDENNEFESPGVMTVMQKISRHIDSICMFGKWAKNVGAFVVMAGAVFAALKSMGIL